MKRIVLVIVLLLIIAIPFKANAVTKDSIFKYLDSQEVCDKESKQLLNQYKLQFSRMIKESDLSDIELELVFNNIKSSVEELKKQGVCKKEDFKDIPSATLDKVEDKLIDAITTVIEAPSIYGEDVPKSINGVVIDRNTMTIQIISNNALADKFELNAKKFNYVGSSKVAVNTSYILIGLFIIISIVIIILKKKNKLTSMMIPLLAIDIVAFIIGISFIVFSKPINIGLGYLNMMRRPDSLVSKKIVVNENHEIMQYPNYYDEYAVLKIDSVNIEEKVAFGDGTDVLAADIGHATTSYMPGEGNTIIYSGHNYKLDNLENIKKNDEIVIETSYGVFTYKVTDTKIMKDNEYGKIEYDTGKEVLVLYTCYPFSKLVYGDKRFVVYAELTKESWAS